MLAAAIVAGLAGCGHTTKVVQASIATAPEAGFGPYSIACVSQSFTRSGTTLLDIYPEKTAAQIGYTALTPNHDGIGISITVFVDSAHAVAQASAVRVMNRQLHRSSLILQDHNVLIEYRNAQNERGRVGSAIRRVRQTCSATP